MPFLSNPIYDPATSVPTQQFLSLAVSGDSHAVLTAGEDDATCLLAHFISPKCFFYLTLTLAWSNPYPNDGGFDKRLATTP